MVESQAGARPNRSLHQIISAILGTFGEIGAFGDMGTEINFSFKNEKNAWAVKVKLKFYQFFQFYKKFYNKFD